MVRVLQREKRELLPLVKGGASAQGPAKSPVGMCAEGSRRKQEEEGIVPFADWLREQMRTRELSNSDLAREVNVGRVTVTSWLRVRSVPYTETCTRLAAARTGKCGWRATWWARSGR